MFTVIFLIKYMCVCLNDCIVLYMCVQALRSSLMSMLSTYPTTIAEDK